MTTHPEIQARAQAELDSVVGPDRLPSYDDMPRLPYFAAMMKEVLRCVLFPIQPGKAAKPIPNVVQMEAGHASRRLAQSNGRRRLQRDAHPRRQHRHRKCLVRAGCPRVRTATSLNRTTQGDFARPATLPEPELVPARAFPEQGEDGAAKGRHGPRGRRVRIRPAQVPWYV